MNPFKPALAKTVSVSVSASNQRVLLLSRDGGGDVQVRVMNNGSATVWISFGDNTVTAALASDIPVAPGGTEVFTTHAVPTGLYAAVIAAGSTGSVYFTPGIGL